MNQTMSRRRLMVQLARLGLGGAALGVYPLFSQPASGVTVQKHPELIVRSPNPLDLETPVHLLDSWITPLDRFYVRSHLYTPEVNADTWRLKVEGAVEHPLSLSLGELKQLSRASEVVTIECAGNGRALFRPRVAGAQWVRGAVGTARWTGIPIAEILKKAGAKTSGYHVVMEAADEPVPTVPDFVRSVPVEKCLQPASLLAFEMNGEPIPVQHGFPLRGIIPGWEGAACVKWLTRLVVQDREAEGFFMRPAYRYPNRRVAPGEAVDPKDMNVLTSLEVKSLITAPREGARIEPGAPVAIEGVAWAGEAEVTRVDVSCNEGRSWQQAEFTPDRARYAWRRFRAECKLPARGSYVLMSRATDSQGRVQPVVPQWNPSGYLHNAVDQVRVQADEGGAPAAVEKGSPAELPEGPGKEIAQRACMVCHDGTLITQQRLDRGRWAGEVEKMVRWGAKLTSEEKERLVDYLFKHFPA